jgi:hypothetical protein
MGKRKGAGGPKGNSGGSSAKAGGARQGASASTPSTSSVQVAQSRTNPNSSANDAASSSAGRTAPTYAASLAGQDPVQDVTAKLAGTKLEQKLTTKPVEEAELKMPPRPARSSDGIITDRKMEANYLAMGLDGSVWPDPGEVEEGTDENGPCLYEYSITVTTDRPPQATQDPRPPKGRKLAQVIKEWLKMRGLEEQVATDFRSSLISPRELKDTEVAAASIMYAEDEFVSPGEFVGHQAGDSARVEHFTVVLQPIITDPGWNPLPTRHLRAALQQTNPGAIEARSCPTFSRALNIILHYPSKVKWLDRNTGQTALKNKVFFGHGATKDLGGGFILNEGIFSTVRMVQGEGNGDKTNNTTSGVLVNVNATRSAMWNPVRLDRLIKQCEGIKIKPESNTWLEFHKHFSGLRVMTAYHRTKDTARELIVKVRIVRSFGWDYAGHMKFKMNDSTGNEVWTSVFEYFQKSEFFLFSSC